MKRHLLPLLFFLAIACIPSFWYRQGEIIHGLDVGLPINYSSFFSKGITTWDYSVNTGKNTILKTGRMPELLLWKFISLSGFSPERLELIYFSIIIFSTLISFYLFITTYSKSSEHGESAFLPLSASVFYLFNLYCLTRWEGVDRAIFYVMIATPLVLTFFYRSLTKESLGNYFLLALCSIVLGAAAINPPSFMVGVLTILIFLLSLWLETFLSNAAVSRKTIFWVGLKAAVVVLIANLFWTLPMLTLGSPASVFTGISPQDWLISMSATATFRNVIRLMGAWHWFSGYGGQPYAPYAQVYFNNPIFTFMTWLVPALILLGIITTFIKKNRQLFFLLLTAIGIFLSMGSNGITGRLYLFFYDHLLFFKIFRSPWFKFSFLIVFAYAYFYASFATAICCFLKKRHRLLSAIFLPIFLVFPIILAYPLAIGNIYQRFWVRIPHTAIEAVSYLKSNLKNGERVMLLPNTHQGTNYPWGYSGVSPILYYLSDLPTLGAFGQGMPNEPVNPFIEHFRHQLNSRRPGGQLLSQLGVKYLLHRKDTANINNDPLDDPKIVEKNMQAQDVKLVKSFGDWDIYQSPDPKPLFSLSRFLVGVKGASQLLLDDNFRDWGYDYLVLPKKEESILPSFRLSPKDFDNCNEERCSYVFTTADDLKYSFKADYAYGSRDHLPYFFLDGQKIGLETKEGFGKTIAMIPKGKHSLEIEKVFLQELNLIKNSDFSEEIDHWELIDVGPYYGNPSKVAGSFRVLGPGRAMIKAVNRSMVVRQLISKMEEGQSYRLRFVHKEEGNEDLQVGFAPKESNLNTFVTKMSPGYFSKDYVTQELVYDKTDPGPDYLVFRAQVESATANNFFLKDLFLGQVNSFKTIDVVPSINSLNNNGLEIKSVSGGPTEYLVQAKTDGPSWLVFNNTYDKGWKAFQGAQILPHYKVNGYANAYYLSEPGDYKIKISFEPQRLFERMALISGGFLALLGLGSVAFWLIRKKKYEATQG